MNGEPVADKHREGSASACPVSSTQGVPGTSCQTEAYLGSGQDSSETGRDHLLVLRCLGGDEDAWAVLVKTYGRLILSFSWRFAGRRDLAEDLTQEIFLRAYCHLNSYRFESASFRTWLFRLSRNLLIDYHRKERRHGPYCGSDALENLSIRDEQAPGPQQTLEQAEAVRFLEAGLMSLAPELREAITLRELEGMSYREIAGIAGAPEGTIKSRVSRGRTQLIRLLSRRRYRRIPQSVREESKSSLQFSYA